MPVPNNSNPMHVSFGNPSLKPYFDHSIRYEFRRTNRQKFSTVTLNFNGGMTQNPIVNASWYGTNGAQYSMPVNGRNSMNMSLRGFYNTPIAKSNFGAVRFLSYILRIHSVSRGCMACRPVSDG